MKPDAETLQILSFIETEISAGKCLFPRDDAERVHNNACDRAIQIIDGYRQGYGLFQMARASKPQRANAETLNPSDSPEKSPNDKP